MNKQNREQYNYTSIFVAHYLYNERDLVSVMDQGIPPIDYEQKALSVNGCVLADQEQIEQEITRLRSALSYDCDFEYDKYASMNRVTNKLSQQIERPTISIGLLKRIIVHMDIELGVKLSFRNVFHQMCKAFQMEKTAMITIRTPFRSSGFVIVMRVAAIAHRRIVDAFIMTKARFRLRRRHYN